MTIQDLLRIVDAEMIKDGYLSKGVRIELVKHIREGATFSAIVSTDDYIRIAASLRSSGHSKRLRSNKRGNAKLITIK